MGLRARVAGIAAGAAGLAAAGTAVRVLHQGRVIARRGVGDRTDLGSLRSEPVTVVADDGVGLHVEVDEVGSPAVPRHAKSGPAPLTVVFVHGYALNLDCWHFQRAGYRGLVRTVFYDQRSHGRSQRSDEKNATIEQLGEDLLTIIEHEAEGPVVLVGHSMGGMSIIALAEEHPELFGSKVVGVALISTTAGGLSPHKIMVPVLPGNVGASFATRLVAGLSRISGGVDATRRIARDLAMVATDRFAFGDDVPASYVAFVDHMLGGTPFEVLAEFFPSFGTLDKFSVVRALERVPTWIICGTEDRLTSIGHSRKLHEHIEGSRLIECEGAGHMVILERHEQVNAALDQLLAAAAEHQPAEPE